MVRIWIYDPTMPTRRYTVSQRCITPLSRILDLAAVRRRLLQHPRHLPQPLRRQFMVEGLAAVEKLNRSQPSHPLPSLKCPTCLSNTKRLIGMAHLTQISQHPKWRGIVPCRLLSLPPRDNLCGLTECMETTCLLSTRMGSHKMGHQHLTPIR